MYNLVTGRLPFEAENIYVLFRTIAKGVYQIPDDIEPHLTSLLNGLLHIDKNSRFTIEQIKQHDWFRRRPPRTFDFLPFPPLALRRFETFTIYDYLTELHQPSIDNNEEQQSQLEDVNTFGDSFLVSKSSHSNHQEQGLHEGHFRQRRSIRSTLNCGCSRTISNENICYETKNRSRQQHRICSLS